MRRDPTSPTTPRRTLEHRVTTLESRVDEVESSHGESIYQLQRRIIRTDLGLNKVLDHLGIQHVSEEDIDAQLDQA